MRAYKRLSLVEQLFRCLKGIDLLVRPIYHRLDPRVRAHVLICVLAYYVEWHLRRAWRSLLFADEELDRDRLERDPVAPAQPSASVRRKKSTHQTAGVAGAQLSDPACTLGHSQAGEAPGGLGPERDDVRATERTGSGTGGGTAAFGNVDKIET